MEIQQWVHFVNGAANFLLAYGASNHHGHT